MGKPVSMSICLKLRSMYEVDKKSIIDISKELNIPKSSVEYRLKIAGTKMRSHREAMLLPGKTGKTKGKIIAKKHRPLGSRRIAKCGYVEVKTAKGWVREHRLILEAVLCRPLANNEVPHHKDGIKNNNLPDNLEPITIAEHVRRHHVGKTRSTETKIKISLSKKGRVVYEKHPSYKHITPDMILRAIRDKGSKAAAAQELMISKRTLYNKMERFNMNKEAA